MTSIRKYTSTGSALIALLAIIVLSGCATKGFVRKQVAESNAHTDAEIGKVRGDVDQVRSREDQMSALTERIARGEYDQVSTHQVQFAFDDFRLSSEAQSMIDQLATELGSHPHYVLEIRGYADATGSDRYNYRLGRERSDEVLRYLLSRHSVPPNRVTIVSFGEESPVADNESKDGRAQNRRAQVRLMELKLDTGAVSANPHVP